MNNEVDYVSRTIHAYDNNPQKYVDSTKDMISYPEIDKFTRHLPSNGTVLDAGCGFGRDANVFATKGYRVTGIDLSDGLLEKGKKLYPEVDFRRMDLRRLEFGDGTFDGAWSSAALLHLKVGDLRVALTEIHRVLKTGGIFFCSFKKGEGTKEVLETFSSDDPRFYLFLTVDSLSKELTDAGFATDEAYEMNERERFGKEKRDLIWVYAFSRK